MHAFLVHRQGDAVGVAIRPIDRGESVKGLVLEDQAVVQVVALAPIPLGHKIALQSVGSGEGVIEYGVTIGSATSAISPGDLVHVHNLRSIRWGSEQPASPDQKAAADPAMPIPASVVTTP
jgi:(2R)-sulfolactate sulfo-lyase subunit alpha